MRIQLKEGKSRKEDLGKSAGEGEGARYVRYNPNIDASRSDDFSLAALYRHLKSKHGFEKVETPVFPVPDKVFFMDAHLEDLLVFPSSTSWWTGDLWYESGAVILQDKASCFPAKVLMEGWESSEGDCLDATYVSIPSNSEILTISAAPGNKTSYISALMGNAGKVHAFERSEGRYKTLEKMLGRAGCSNVTPRRADFLDSKPNDKEFAKVTRMYVAIIDLSSYIVFLIQVVLDLGLSTGWITCLQNKRHKMRRTPKQRDWRNSHLFNCK